MKPDKRASCNLQNSLLGLCLGLGEASLSDASLLELEVWGSPRICSASHKKETCNHMY